MSSGPEKPYIGVTGIVRVNEAEAITQAFVHEGLTKKDSNHRGMVGLLASQKTLSISPVTTSRYPDLTRIRQIFEATRGIAFNTLHYSTSNTSDLSSQVGVLMNRTNLYSDQLCDGVQLNMPWPPPSELGRVKNSFPNLKIILQLGPRVLYERTAEDMIKGLVAVGDIVKRLVTYAGLINYILVDPSGGQGLIAETDILAAYYQPIKNIYPDLPMIFAGGFNAQNVSNRLLLLSQTLTSKDFGIDAERGLRTPRQNLVTTDINIPDSIKYIQNAASFFRN